MDWTLIVVFSVGLCSGLVIDRLVRWIVER
jgi:hypothetical protein